jgi:hypothetical protein
LMSAPSRSCCGVRQTRRPVDDLQHAPSAAAPPLSNVSDGRLGHHERPGGRQRQTDRHVLAERDPHHSSAVAPALSHQSTQPVRQRRQGEQSSASPSPRVGSGVREERDRRPRSLPPRRCTTRRRTGRSRPDMKPSPCWPRRPTWPSGWRRCSTVMRPPTGRPEPLVRPAGTPVGQYSAVARQLPATGVVRQLDGTTPAPVTWDRLLG